MKIVGKRLACCSRLDSPAGSRCPHRHCVFIVIFPFTGREAAMMSSHWLRQRDPEEYCLLRPTFSGRWKADLGFGKAVLGVLPHGDL